METIPSFLSGPGQSHAGANGFLNNIRLRIGEVQELVPPKDKRNRNKKFNEYRVFVQHKENGTATTKMYEGCLLVNMFGGLADYLKFTLRADKVAEKKKGAPGLGSKVLLLCINGESHSAVILGGLRDAEFDKDEDKGHNLTFAFNGVDVEIDKDGQLKLSVNGPTKADGKAVSENSKLPSTIKIEKDGKITAVTGSNSVIIEHGKVTINSESAVEVNCQTAKINASQKASVVAKIIELGSEGIGGIPAMGLVHGSWIEPLTGKPVFMLGGTSSVVFGKK